jgi:hypothetical protein
MIIPQIQVSTSFYFVYVTLFLNNIKKAHCSVVWDVGGLPRPVVEASSVSGYLMVMLCGGSEVVGTRLIYEIKNQDTAEGGADPAANVVIKVCSSFITTPQNSHTIEMSSQSTATGILDLVKVVPYLPPERRSTKTRRSRKSSSTQ